VRYEIAVAIKTGWIVSYNGPFQCGSWPDLKIFRSRLKQWLLLGEKVVADRGYRVGSRICHPDYGTEEQQEAMNTARARHETVNGRLKTWKSMKQGFRHSLDKHYLVFRAALVIEQIKIQSDKPPFQVDAVVDPIIAWE